MLGFLLLSMVYFTSGMQYACLQEALYQFEDSSFLRSTPSPRCLQSVLQGVLRGDAWFLTVVNDVFHDRNAVCMSPESSVSILKSLATLEVPRLLGVSRASSKESRRTCFVPDCSQWCITRQECSMHVTRKLYENLQVISCKFCSY